MPPCTSLTLGEGGTPLLRSRRSPNVWLKNEGANPLGTSAARGIALAVAMARAAGIPALTTGGDRPDATAALLGYAAAGGLQVHLFLPPEAPRDLRLAAAACGAATTSIPESAGDGARHAGEWSAAHGALDLSSPSHPWRVEGDKTLGYELAEQLGWELPDVILCGAQTPRETESIVVVLTKAAEELAQLGWLRKAPGRTPALPRILRALPLSAKPKGVGEDLYVSDGESLEALRDWATHEGILLSRAGAAAAAAYAQLRAQGSLRDGDCVVLVEPANGWSEPDWAADQLRFPRSTRLPERMPVGGIITPQ